MKREDFVFTIGFDGNKAIVDRKSRSLYGRLGALELADKGLFREAYRSAVFDGDSRAAQEILERFNRLSPVGYRRVEELNRVFGVRPPSADITGVSAV